MIENIIDKIENAGLVGRGGAGFPTARKWRDVASSESDEKFVICNASEGEIGLFKDIHILEHHPEGVVTGIKIALDFLNSKKAFFNINENYHHKVAGRLTNAFRDHNEQGYDFRFFIEEPTYIGGEETALLNAIEGNRTEPRKKPPYPSVVGLWGHPTLINNVETFFNVSLIDEGKYKGNRFSCISGKVRKEGVFHLPAEMTLENILHETDNYPDFDFFVQVGGSASGVILNRDQIKTQIMSGAGGLEIYDINTDPKDILFKWFNFYQKESCGKCVPCRMGSYQLFDILKNCEEVPWDRVFEVLESTKNTSFCALGGSINTPVDSYYSNILKR